MNVIKVEMFPNIFANFCDFTTPIIFFFVTPFLDKLAKIFSVPVQYVASWSAGIQDWTYFLGHTWRFTFIGYVNFCLKCVRTAQT